MPVVQLMLFGYAINTVVDHMALVVDDEAHDAASRGLVEALQNSSYYDVVGQATSRDRAITAINTSQARVGLVIPLDFGTQTCARPVGPGAGPGRWPAWRQGDSETDSQFQRDRQLDHLRFAGEYFGGPHPLTAARPATGGFRTYLERN
jgi:hypothetical protein